MKLNPYRVLSLLVLASVALSARATDAYSNLGPSPASYATTDGYVIGLDITQGAQFTATAGGSLTGLQVALNNDAHLGSASGSHGYTLRLYSNGAADTLGDLLGTYSGTSTGVDWSTTTTALSNVAAIGPAVTITSGATYWLVASNDSNDSDSALAWNKSLATNGLRYVGPNLYVSDYAPAFSVQVASPVPEPSSLVALPFALMALRRKVKVKRA